MRRSTDGRNRRRGTAGYEVAGEAAGWTATPAVRRAATTPGERCGRSHGRLPRGGRGSPHGAAVAQAWASTAWWRPTRASARSEGDVLDADRPPGSITGWRDEADIAASEAERLAAGTAGCRHLSFTGPAGSRERAGRGRRVGLATDDLREGCLIRDHAKALTSTGAFNSETPLRARTRMARDLRPFVCRFTLICPGFVRQAAKACAASGHIVHGRLAACRVRSSRTNNRDRFPARPGRSSGGAGRRGTSGVKSKLAC